MATKRYVEVYMAGVGGQGMQSVGKLLLEAGHAYYKHAFFMPQYGALMRGELITCSVILSDDPIMTWGSRNPPTAIAMGMEAFRLLDKAVQPGGSLFVDNTLVQEKSQRTDIKAYYIPTTKVASEIGNPMVANMVLLGAYLEATKAIAMEEFEKHLDNIFKGRRGEALLPLNRQALRQGAAIVKQQQKK
ncbi:MAG: 2-oxoacid:acceptor oxidoreductase family protein [Chloroflexi bacterium]|nr:2-oxoacid:acceptor oxidoreductase family protein [Chloroflexota bacterium]